MSVGMVIGVVAFLVVAGWAAVAWFRHGRDPSYIDDPSVLLPAPPPAMTAATATVVAGGGGRVAFMTAMLDLASRDEIAFVAEGRSGRVDLVGIAFHGGDSTDPRVRLNRRNPIGEGETWLLAELKAAHAMADRRGAAGGAPPPPEVMAAGMQMMASMLRIGATTAEDDDSGAARSAREHGLASLGMPDVGALEHAYEARTGHPMKDAARQGLEQMMNRMSVMSDLQGLAGDPDRAAALVELTTGRTLTSDEHQELRDQLGAWAAQAAATPPAPPYIPAAEARRLQAPFLFGTLLQTYARRHGWIGGLRLFASLRWYLLGTLEVVVGAVLAAVGSRPDLETVQWLGGGIAAGGLATIVIGRAMPALSREGAMMKVQLAAYRRTLAATFGQASSLDEVVATHRLPWLETPDQTLVWGVALGLRHDIEALLARSARALAAGASAATTYVPAWYGTGSPGGPGAAAPDPRSTPGAVADPAAMFAGIEAIGSEVATSRARGR